MPRRLSFGGFSFSPGQLSVSKILIDCLIFACVYDRHQVEKVPYRSRNDAMRMEVEVRGATRILLRRLENGKKL